MRPARVPEVVGFAASGLLWAGSVLVGGTVLTAALFGASRGAFRTFGVALEATVQTAVSEAPVGRDGGRQRIDEASSCPWTIVGGLAGTVVGVRPVMLAGGLGAAGASVAWAPHPALRGFEPPTEVDAGQFGEAL